MIRFSSHMRCALAMSALSVLVIELLLHEESKMIIAAVATVAIANSLRPGVFIFAVG